MQQQLIQVEGVDVFYLTKHQAAEVSNILQEFQQMEIRLDYSLSRERDLNRLLHLSNLKLEQKRNAYDLLYNRMELKQTQLDETNKLLNKQKRRSFFQNTGIGIVLGAVITLVLIN